MNETVSNLMCELLDCWSMDIEYLSNLLDRNDIKINLRDLKDNHWELNINIIIYDVFTQIAKHFISENEIGIKQVYGIWKHEDVNEYLRSNEIYTIYTNCIDSHLWFHDDDIQESFEYSPYYT